MAKLESSFKNMSLSLTTIALVAALALAGIYGLTKERIETQKELKKQAAIRVVLPEGVEIGEEQSEDVMIGDKSYSIKSYVAKKDGKYAGIAVETLDPNGFSGEQRFMIGFDAEGKIYDYKVLEQSETPGLGAKIETWFRDTTKAGQCIIGREVNEKLRVRKDAGGEVDAITAATISSRAFLRGVHLAYKVAHDQEVEAESGASKKVDN